MTAFRRAFLITFTVSVLVIAAFAGGYLLRGWTEEQRPQFPVFDEAYQILKDHAYNPLPTPPVLEYGMIRGLLQAYGDPHTAFLEPPQTELESNTLSGKFGGIGVRMGTDDQGQYVLYPLPDSPAAKAGVKEGDRLVGVEALEVQPGTPLDQIQAAIRGPVGEPVTIRVARSPDFASITIKIERAEIALPSVTWHLEASEPRLGVIEVNVIADSTADEIQKAAADLQSRGATAFALDLRNNGGGLLDSGIEVARLFLKEGVVMEQQFRDQPVKTYKVETAGPLADVPLVVLTNGGTASASEIISGALQAHRRAKLIGETTYGKNTIQLVFQLKDQSSIHVTAAQWWIPGLDLPKPGKGLQPDIPVAAGGPPDPVIQAAIQTLFGK
jgi:carboxyl-terminal processing protease